MQKQKQVMDTFARHCILGIYFESVPFLSFSFTTTYVLSESDDCWEGLKGRISHELLENEVFNTVDKSKENVLICACGPTAFTKEAVR